jgi:hypothetical protein
MEEIKGSEKVKMVSFYLDGMALYWHQNFIRSLRGREVIWEEYIELCVAGLAVNRISSRSLWS